MPQLTYPCDATGLWVDVRVNLDGTTLQSLHAAGRPIPNSIQVRGLIDTGSDVSAVAPSILQQFGIAMHAHGTTQAIGGNIPIRLFNVTLLLLDASQPQLPWLVRPDLLVMELPGGAPVDVIVGLDVLQECKLYLDGPGRQFTLEH
jgi:hypothetical protein